MQGHFQPLAEDDLEDVAGVDVLDALADGRLEIGLGEVRAVRQRHVAFGADVERLQQDRDRLPAGKLLDQLVDAAARRLVGLGRGNARLVQPGHRHHHDGLGDVVEHDHLVVEGEGHVGHLAVVGRGMGQVLEVADRVVAGVSDRTATEGGQLRQMDRPNRLDPPPKLVQRVVAIELAGHQRRRPPGRNPRIGIRRHPAAIGLDLEERLGGQKAVAAHFLAAHDALEQASAASGVDLVEGA